MVMGCIESAEILNTSTVCDGGLESPPGSQHDISVLCDQDQQDSHSTAEAQGYSRIMLKARENFTLNNE